MSKKKKVVEPEVGIMFDIESLDVGPRSVVTEVAFVAFDLADPTTVLKSVEESLPIEPQLALRRTISADTLLWWMKQPELARSRMQNCTGNDMEELFALIRSINRKFLQVTKDKDYEVFARGPQFDIVNIESLCTDAGEDAPWQYYKVRDLRTIMATAGIHSADVERNLKLHPEHIAKADCMYQIQCLAEANARLGQVAAGGR